MEWVIGADFHQLKKIMSEIMDDFDAGKKFAQNKVIELMDEVITEYELLAEANDYKEEHLQLNAVKFMKNWVISGGHEDENGNRVCLVW